MQTPLKALPGSVFVKNDKKPGPRPKHMLSRAPNSLPTLFFLKKNGQAQSARDERLSCLRETNNSLRRLAFGGCIFTTMSGAGAPFDFALRNKRLAVLRNARTPCCCFQAHKGASPVWHKRTGASARAEVRLFGRLNG